GDLAHVVKTCRNKGLTIGSDVGIISYNDNPLKEIIANGITTISTHFSEMGKKMAAMVLSQSKEKFKNSIQFTLRNSL
ncbi:MAG: substrate-binding domain-containing protein, partial [Leptolyngbyaceae cyanobacterium SM1_4_3]|nr:substrate-binding domain-containing protein [Leptolyngbyaceae cyanobacterium SM1_4_3]